MLGGGGAGNSGGRGEDDKIGYTMLMYNIGRSMSDVRLQSL